MNEFKITGLDEVKRALKQIPPKLAQRIAQTAVRQGANYLAKEIRAAAPVKTGRLRKAIKVKISKINRLQRNGVVGMYVQVDPGKSRKDPKGAWYGKFVEVGYRHGSKVVTGGQAVRLGIITRQQLTDKKLSHAKYRGRRKQGIRYRHGGKPIPGQHFVLKTFNQHGEQTGRIVAAGIEQAFIQTAQHLGLKTTA